MKMVEIGKKEITEREAIVEGEICVSPEVISVIKDKTNKKGDVLEAAKVAGIFAAKKTPEIIPLCHPIPIEYMSIEFSLMENSVKIKTTVRSTAKTGVEMEALSATSIAALTIYDMCKYIDKGMVIGDIKLMKKTGGKSGEYIR